MKGTQRNVVLDVILSIITRGIYHWYWMCVTNNEVNAYLEEEDTRGGMVVFLSIITRGIYGLFWYYKMGRKLEQTQIKANGHGSNFAVLFLILSTCRLSIVTNIIIQSKLNKAWAN